MRPAALWARTRSLDAAGVPTRCPPREGVQGHRPVTPAPGLPPARVESPERQSFFGKWPRLQIRETAVNQGNPLIGRKTRLFLRKVFSARRASKQQKNSTSCNIELPKAREAVMAENGTYETGLSKTISDVERSRREVAVDYACASVSLEGLSLSASSLEKSTSASL